MKFNFHINSQANSKPVPDHHEKFHARKKTIAAWFKYSFASFAGALCLLALILLGYILAYAWPAISKVNLFGTVFDPKSATYGALTLIIGTLTVTVIALAIAIPISLFTSLFVVTYFPNGIVTLYKIVIEIFAGLPSILFGLLGIVFLSKFIPLSFALAGLVLSVMVIPIVSAFIIIALTNVSKYNDLNAYALGATKLETIYTLKIRFIKRGLFISSLAGLARAIGETMAVAMVIGGSSAIPDFSKFINGFLSRSGSSLTVSIVTNFLEAQGLLVNVIFYFGFILFLFVAIVNTLAFYILSKDKHGHAK